MRIVKDISLGIIFVLLLLLMNSILVTPTNNIASNNEEELTIDNNKIDEESKTMIHNPVNILLLLDNNYGGNYAFIRDILEGFGWNITTTALTETVTPCGFHTVIETVDVLFTEVDLTQFDCLSIMPGETYNGLLNSAYALNKIAEAVESDLIVTAWCSAVRILAKADVIDGLEVTGHIDYISEYEAAGATWMGWGIPPITQGNIITSCRSQFFRKLICNTIAKAIYDDYTEPELESYSVDPQIGTKDTSFKITAVINEDSVLEYVSARLYPLDPESKERTTIVSAESKTLYVESGNTYTGNITARFIENGYYEVELFALDICGNNCTSILGIINVGMEEESSQASWTLSIYFLFSWVAMYVIRNKKRTI